ncbi:HesA/MoeB/ThiF family protein [Pontivivens nitratireducens]|uniref:Molybdopterin-synthase adenylyltransferase n=1 Tax=Pontivivens nitratireducens TaxID=2758038 RepID=A0A6G7VPI0_9RHOB|nr:molybdopterin-synthase adenylyltransferase MoeB [Pontibrevibacter nitratireducens]QIK41830.1 molybdopterin-synthase adenylyltransferase MoeB [Pontibrevibacter nitratireducens]
MTLTPEELTRYARHIVLREVGGPGQMKLRAARALIVGAGGLGAPASMYLAAAGVGTIGIVDDDTVSLSNLQRQIVHDTTSIDTPKVESAARTLNRINPHVAVEGHAQRLTQQASPDMIDGPDLIDGYDLILDGSDSYQTRYLVNALCVAAGKPLISAAMTQWEGQVSLYHPAAGTPCYACVFPQAPADGLAPSCAEAGIVGALGGIIGSMMAMEAIKHITGAGQTLAGSLLLYDALYADSRRITIARDPACKVCGV